MSVAPLTEVPQPATRGVWPDGIGAGRPAVLPVACLSFDAAVSRAACEHWASLPDAQRAALLSFADRSGVTLHLWRALEAAGVIQAAEREWFEERLRKNRLRLEQLREQTAHCLELFQARGLRAAVLKGFPLAPDFVAEPEYRVQYDLDFYLSPDDAGTAFDLLLKQGYEPVAGGLRTSDHLPTVIRKTGWEWRGDFFDPDIPAGVELHFRLWDAEFERVFIEFAPEPLSRLASQDGWPVLDRRDQLAFCVLHVLRHLFRGGLRLSHIYEIAYFLERHADNEAFWAAWCASPNTTLRRFCAAGFALAQRLFACRLAPRVAAEIGAMPAGARAWVRQYGLTAIEPERSGKVEVLLLLSFVAGWWNRALVLQRRLLPASLPGPVDALYLPDTALSFRRRLLRAARQTRFVLGRAAFHLLALPRFLWAAARW